MEPLSSGPQLTISSSFKLNELSSVSSVVDYVGVFCAVEFSKLMTGAFQSFAKQVS